MKHRGRWLVVFLAVSVWTAPAPAQSFRDLREMEAKVRSVADRAVGATVSVRFAGFTENQGSGVIVSEDGLVLTAAHVIHLDLDRPERYRRQRTCQVTLADGREFTGVSLGIQTSWDCGAVQMIDPPEDLPVIPLGDEDALDAGDWCLALGHPGGFKAERPPVLRLGRVQPVRGDRRFLRTDCQIISGDSGGPLLDLDGRLIGIHSRIQESTAGNYHARVSNFRRAWDDLLQPPGATNEVSAPRARLGIRGQDEEDGGVRIVALTEGGGAQRAGLAVGDVIHEIGRERVHDLDDLLRELSEWGVGDRVRVRVRRGETPLTYDVILGGR